MSDTEISNNINKKNTIFSLVAALVLISAVIVFRLVLGFKPFCTNDVVLMKSFANGTYNGVKDGHLVYTMYCLGEVFVCLYSLFPKVEWYDILMLFFHLASWFLIIYKSGNIFEKKSGKLGAFVCAAFIIIAVDLKYIIFFEYTDTAGIICAAGILYLGAALSDGRKADFIIAGITFILALWIRKEVFFMSLPLIVLIILSREFMINAEKAKNAENYKTKSKTIFIFALCMLCAIAASFIIEKAAYSSENWKDFKKYNDARTKISDYYGWPAYDEIKEILDSYEISEDEYTSFSRGNINFSSKFSTEAVCRIADYAEETRKTVLNPVSIKAIVKQMFIEWYFSIKQFAGIVIIIFCVTNIIFAIRRKKYGYCPITILGVMYESLFICYFVYRGRYPEKVAHVLNITQLIFQMTLLMQIAAAKGKVQSEKEKNEAHPAKRYIVSAFAVCAIAVLSGIFTAKEIKDAREYTVYWSDYLEEDNILTDFCRENSGNIYIVSTSVGSFLCDYMLDDSNIYARNAVYLGFWTADSPLLDKKLGESSITDISKALTEGENVYYIQREEEDTDYLTDYYASQGIKVHTETVEELYGARGKNLVLKIIAD